MAKVKKPSKKAVNRKTTTAKPKRKSPSKTQPASKPVPPEIRNLKPLNYQLMLERIRDGMHFTAEELGHALKVNFYYGYPMPEAMMEYYFQFLTGGLEKGHRRKAEKRDLLVWEAYAIEAYIRKMAEVEAEREALGTKRRRTDEQKKRFKKSPGEEAADWVLTSILKGKKVISEGRLRNLKSERNKAKQ